jgi:ribosomal protein S18 acetylase RimI-like enzyme
MPEITVRAAALADIPFVRRMSVASVEWGIPATRSVAPHEVQARTRQRLADLEMVLLNENFSILIAQLDQQPAGFIMIDLMHEESSTGERQAFIVDLAVEPRHWGRYVVHHLIEAATVKARECGLQYLVGEVSASNERALLTATKRLGFTVERLQIVRPTSPSAAPGKPRPAD